MIIAISAENDQREQSKVAHHFGRCPFFALVEVQGTDIIDYNLIENPYFEFHQPGQVPSFINGQKAKVMLSGGMGRRAIEFFNEYGIESATGASGTVENAVLCYLEGQLSGASSCAESEAHGHGHQHGHNHDHEH